MEERKLEEIAFHDKLRDGAYEQRWSPEAEARVAHEPVWANFKYYSIEQNSIDLMRKWLLENCRGSVILDYCCGNGDESLFVARNGAKKVVGIDISPLSIQNCNERAAAENLQDTVSFKAMDAEAMEFDDNTFDFMMEYGVLHHLDLHKGMAELARVLKPGGCMVCTETLGHNILIKTYRRRTPELRTAWEAEHILTKESFDIIKQYFGRIEMHFFHLFALGAVPFRHTPFFPVILGALRLIDSVLLKIPGLRWQAWQVVFKLSEPRKTR
ncbi:MAG: class I SAM-dependent methyltransferase [Gemmatimonadaceae bacterium]|nr:class I SAM-dependent methyltransferase [Gemmatimonadaceae bacterium]